MRDTRRYEQILADYEEADRITRAYGRGYEAQALLWEKWFLRTIAADYTHLPNVKSANVKSFVGTLQTAAVTATSWQTYSIPKNATFVSIFALGGASGGGAGLTRAAGAATIAGGGCGGNSGAIARGTWMAALLPKTLNILPGNGGIGGTGTGVAGIVGARSFVTDNQGITTGAGAILISGSAAAVAGSAGNATGGQAATLPETLGAASNNIYACTALSMLFVIGLAGSGNGAGTGAAGTTLTYQSTTVSLVIGGTGAGTMQASSNTDRAGGAITGAGLMPTLAGGAAAAGAGNSGYTLWRPFMAIGGTGGGSAGAAGTGGQGGAGGLGCGGGGGGPGTTGGKGGAGGPGLVMVAWW